MGKKLLKKYIRYKKKRKGYRGTGRVERVRYYWEFTNPPPDYVKFLQKLMEKRVKEWRRRKLQSWKLRQSY